MKKNKIYLILGLTACLSLRFIACTKDDEIDGSKIIIPGADSSELGRWIDSTFRVPYNIDVEYKWNSSDADPSRNLVPPKEYLVKPFLKTVLKIWIDPYSSVSDEGNEFMKDYSCRKLKLIGSGSYNEGSVTLGLAENGYKITLYTINDFDLEAGVSRNELREYFRVMHHEFGHILNQRKDYDTDFQNITGNYTSDWTSINNSEAREMGFISAYARSADTEDFVEILSYYITYTDDEWNDLTGSISSQEGVDFINQKVQVVSSYMNDTYGIDILDLREAITTAVNEVAEGNLD